MINLFAIIKDATKKVPATKYAVGVAGVAAVVAMIFSLRMSLRVALWGTIVVFGLMTLLVVFAKLTEGKNEDFRLPAIILMWTGVILFVGICSMLTTSVFLKKPIDLESVLVNSRVPDYLEKKKMEALFYIQL